MAHQVVGPNVLLRTRKTEQQKIGFKAFGEPQRQWELAGVGWGKVGPEEQGNWEFSQGFGATLSLRQLPLLKANMRLRGREAEQSFQQYHRVERIFQNWWKHQTIDLRSTINPMENHYKEKHYLDTLLENCWKSKTKRNLKSSQIRGKATVIFRRATIRLNRTIQAGRMVSSSAD